MWEIALAAAVIGGVFGSWSFSLDSFLAGQKGRREKAILEEQKEEDLALLDLQFEIAKDEANKNANRLDAKSTANEQFVANDVNNNLDALQLQQESQTLNYNIAAMNSGAQKGNELSQMAGSGVRNSSMNDAIDMEASLNAQQLQLQEDYDRANGDIQLNSILGGLAGNIFNIQTDRENAAELRNSFNNGGNQYKLYQANRNKTINGYERAKTAIDNNIKDNYEGINGFLNWTQSLLGGARTGMNTAINVNSMIENFGNVNYDTGAGMNNSNMMYSWNNLGWNNNIAGVGTITPQLSFKSPNVSPYGASGIKIPYERKPAKSSPFYPATKSPYFNLNF